VSESITVTISLAEQHGLTRAEAARRLAETGRNELLVRRRTGVLVVVARQLTDTVILVLLAAPHDTALAAKVQTVLVHARFVAVTQPRTAFAPTREPATT